MSGLQEVSRIKQRLDATFDRVGTINPESLELQSDFAKYLCILVSGYIERAIVEIVQEHARRNGSTTLQKFVEANTNKITNLNPQKIADFLGNFSKEWGHEIKEFLSGDQRAAIGAIVSNRHQIAHGRESEITYNQVRYYYQKSQNLIDRVQKLCLEG